MNLKTKQNKNLADRKGKLDEEVINEKERVNLTGSLGRTDRVK